MRTDLVSYTRTLYTWDELSESAKDNARDNMHTHYWESGYGYEVMDEAFSFFVMEENGWDEAHHLTYSLYSQGGFPVWSGTKTFEYEGNFFTASVNNHSYGGSSNGFMITVDIDSNCDHSCAVDCDCRENEILLEDDAHEWFTEYVEGLSSDLYYRMVAADEAMVDDDSMADTSEANGYEYLEDGSLA